MYIVQCACQSGEGDQVLTAKKLRDEPYSAFFTITQTGWVFEKCPEIPLSQGSAHHLASWSAPPVNNVQDYQV